MAHTKNSATSTPSQSGNASLCFVFFTFLQSLADGAEEECNGRQSRGIPESFHPHRQWDFSCHISGGGLNKFLPSHLSYCNCYFKCTRQILSGAPRSRKYVNVFCLNLSPLNTYRDCDATVHQQVSLIDSDKLNTRYLRSHRINALGDPVLLQLLCVSHSSVKNTTHSSLKLCQSQYTWRRAGTRRVKLLLTCNKTVCTPCCQFQILRLSCN